MFARLIMLLVPALLIAGSVLADSTPRLDVDAAPAIVRVKPLPVSRKPIRLPALEFQLDIRARCARDTEMQSILISVADTTKTISGDDVTEIHDEPIPFSVPARQVSPVAVDGFCRADGGRDRRTELLVRDAVTTNLSLRCAGEEGESITYTSHALDVLVQCDDNGESQGDSVSEIVR